MPAKDLGTKHVCWKCSTKYYDLKKPSPVCPKCGADPRAAPVVKPPSAAERKAKAVREAAEEPAEALEEAELDEELDEPDDAAEAEADDE